MRIGVSGVKIGVSGVRIGVSGVRIGVSGVRVGVTGVRVGVSGVRVRVGVIYKGVYMSEYRGNYSWVYILKNISERGEELIYVYIRVMDSIIL